MTEIASHRGGAAHWPENSEIAFRETAKLPVEQIEFDVQVSRDGVPVIFHDATLDRVTDGAGPLAGKTLEELKRLTISGGGGAVMTLDEGLGIVAESRLTARCEIKPDGNLKPYPGIVDKTLSALARFGLLDRTVITSFHLPTLAEVKARQMPLRDLIWLVSDQVFLLTSPAHVASLAKSAGIDAVAPRHTLLRGGVLELLRAEGVRAGAFAVLEDEAIEWAFAAEIDVFTTDRPIDAVRIREDLATARKQSAKTSAAGTHG